MIKYTEELADFSFGLDYTKIPKRVAEKVKWAILDTLGIILGATSIDFGRKISEFVKEWGDREEATILGFGFRSSTRNAAFVNGALSEMLELQDGYTKGGYHPSSPTIPASLAIAERNNKTGKDLITAVAAGYETGIRVAESMHPSHLFKGFLTTGTVGTVGAAAAVAKILGLSAEETFNALAIGGFISPISSGDNLWGGYTVKPFHGGAAARAGIEAALMAKKGLTGAALEGDPKIQKGFCKITSDNPKFERIIEGLGEEYRLEGVFFKPYASCRINHGPIEAALSLKREYSLNHEDIEQILVKTYDFAAKGTGSMKTDTNSTFVLCQFSMPYAIAGALMYGEVGLKQLMPKNISNPKIHRLASRVEVVVDQNMQKMYPACRPCTVEIAMKNGGRFSRKLDYAKGDYRNPMTEEELTAKFLGLTENVIGGRKARDALAAVLDMENLDSVEQLINYLK